MANAGGAAFRWVLQLHRDVPRAARLYSEGLDFSVNVCTLRWAELQSGPLKLALMHSPRFRSVTVFSFEYSLIPFRSDPCAMRSSTTPSYFADQFDITMQKGYSSMLSFTVADMNSTVTKLMSLGAELDGPIKYEIHGKVAALRCLDGHMQNKEDHAVLPLAKLNAQLGSSSVHEEAVNDLPI
ncbi:glyoxalase bleomycin resistance protein dioxygenase [Musa troglodytarum]|uniref:Glyoxalase bleomycin resistance protein dioxygenase n=1 Tax=Musa troglodytarum TaxID=320322 RepID=A0A9E7KUS4_9LILI|nr:glyoxalase bleomycin resistance protein dioxygenase [Musa troglodytarum]